MPSPPLRLLTFGTLALERTDGQALPAEAKRGRHLALLAVLAAAGPKGAPKSELIRLFWPHAPKPASLSNLEWAISNTLGVDPIEAVQANRLHLRSSVIAADVQEFRDALQNEQLDEAVRLYEGPFLDQFAMSNEPESFTRWVKVERARLRRELLRGIAKLSRSGRHATATQGWERVEVLEDEEDQQAAAEFVRALLRGGRVGQARREADRCMTLIRQGAPLEGTLAEAIEDAQKERQGGQEPVGAERPARSAADGWEAQAADPGRHRACFVAVLDFEDKTPGSGYDWLAPLLADYISAALNRSPEVHMISRERAIQVPTHAVGWADPARPNAAQEVRTAAAELGADHLVCGRYEVQDDSRIILEAVVVEPDGELTSLGGRLEGRLQQIHSLTENVARRTAQALFRLHLEPSLHARHPHHHHSENLTAVELYARGRQHFRDFTPAGLQQAEERFKQALELEPRHALAHAGLGSIYVFRYIENPDPTLLRTGIEHLN